MKKSKSKKNRKTKSMLKICQNVCSKQRRDTNKQDGVLYHN